MDSETDSPPRRPLRQRGRQTRRQAAAGISGRRTAGQQGFTLLELAIVLVCAAILVTLVLVFR